MGSDQDDRNRSKRFNKAEKGKIFDELWATSGWHRSNVRNALGTRGRPRVVRERAPRAPLYGPDVVESLRFCWAVLESPDRQVTGSGT